MKVEVDLPNPPEGYEYTGEYRGVKPGELYLNRSTEFTRWNPVEYSFGNFHILRPVTPPWQPPTGIFRPGWVVRDLNGEVWWSSSEPEFDEDILEWLAGGAMEEITESINIEWPDITGEKAIWQVY